ncbi:E2 [Macaca mulatta papillomavirus 4]|uniref:Regulatory protein E2 n=1 Tax=Macaca mulatta papillomavirus 4 TaxID=2294152 RepID=A0A385AHA5_9PAPI|nr:E2 [Macaca mulatta papillomavirus 4]AXN57297.1 E2 [Macaca mulatta papillomavirus 4]
METLTERFETVQEALLKLYESEATDIDTQIEHWNLIRKENILLHYARKNGVSKLGLHTVPQLTVSEHNAKQAIKMVLLLQKLKDSEYGKERWTLTDTSLELFNTPPKNCLKKGGFTVDVLYDNEESKRFPYTAWTYIYYLNDNDEWEKVPGKADYYGLYYEESGHKRYYSKFEEDAAQYGQTGIWEVRYKNNIISAPVTSSTKAPGSGSAAGVPARPTGHTETDAQTRGGRRKVHFAPRGCTPSTNLSSPLREEAKRPRGGRVGRGGQQRGQGEQGPPQRGESPSSKRRRIDIPDSSTGRPTFPSPSEVGSRHRSVEGGHRSRLQQLQDEARDPPVVIIKGIPNILKCWRNRTKQKNSRLFTCISSVFTWKDDDDNACTGSGAKGRMLVAFDTTRQRDIFLKTVHLPKGTSYDIGSLGSL